MKEKAIMPLYPYFLKYVGIIVALTGIVLWILLGADYQLMLYLGLLIMIFSREKNEDDQVRKIRTEVFKTIFGYYFSLLIALHLVELLSSGFVLEMPPMFIIGLPLALYLLVFYLLLVFNFGKSEASTPGNEKRSSLYYIIFLIVLLVVLTLIILRILLK